MWFDVIAGIWQGTCLFVLLTEIELNAIATFSLLYNLIEKGKDFEFGWPILWFCRDKRSWIGEFSSKHINFPAQLLHTWRRHEYYCLNSMKSYLVPCQHQQGSYGDRTQHTIASLEATLSQSWTTTNRVSRGQLYFHNVKSQVGVYLESLIGGKYKGKLKLLRRGWLRTTMTFITTFFLVRSELSWSTLIWPKDVGWLHRLVYWFE